MSGRFADPQDSATGRLLTHQYRVEGCVEAKLPTDHDYAVPTREYQTNQSSIIPARLLLPLSRRTTKADNDKNNPIDAQRLTGHSISGAFRFKTRLQVLQSTLQRFYDGLGPVCDTKTHQDNSDMRLNRRFLDVEFLADFAIAFTRDY